jgi:hypothetical protein
LIPLVTVELIPMTNRSGYQPISQGPDEEEADIGDSANVPRSPAARRMARGLRRAARPSIDLKHLDNAFKRSGYVGVSLMSVLSLMGGCPPLWVL